MSNSSPTIDHRIAGRVATGTSSRTLMLHNPATGEPSRAVRLAESSDVDSAVAAARQAAQSWREVSVSKRAAVLFAFRQLVETHVDDLAAIITAEHGKVLSDARGEVLRGLDVVEFACGIPHLLKGDYSDQVSAGVDSYSFRQPLGVCVGITPFNFPVMVPMWMHPIAIGCGNTFVLKPSERDPSASNLVAELYAKAGLPDGVFNVVHGDRVAVDALLDHGDVAAVSFVGSTPVARHVHERATASGKRVQALGGAKNHVVVLPDADLDVAADHITAAAFGSAGQRCMAISVVVAVGDVADPLVDRLSGRAAAIRVGRGDDPASEMGPLVSAAALQRIRDYIGRGELAGARLAVDGRGIQVPGAEQGYFLGATVLDGVTPTMEVYTDEIFGPVLSIIRVATLADAVALINANPYGNGTCVMTRSGAAARAFVRQVDVGMVGINVPIPVPMAFHSFGGWRSSLFGDTHVHGPEGVRFYTRAKVVTARWPDDDVVAAPASFHFPTTS